jgi:hypothetical protein
MGKLTKEEIIDICKNINFIQISENSFINVGNSYVLNVFSDCIEYIEIDKKRVIFDLRGNIDLGMLLVVFQNYGIIHERYIYERMDAIAEQFENEIN